MIEIENLWKTYRGQAQAALQGISLHAAAEERIGIIGANGSGKTTLFRLILNLLRPDRGRIAIRGETDLEQAKRHLGFVPEHQEGFQNFTPRELLHLAARMSGLSRHAASEETHRLLQWIRLEDQQNELVAGFSKGMIQRLQLGLALIHRPAILLLDEPMSGLDPDGQRHLAELLQALEGITLLYASHQLTELEDLCDRVLIFHQGKVKADLKLSEQREEIFILETEPGILQLLEHFRQAEIKNQTRRGSHLRLEIQLTPEDFQKLLAACRENQIAIQRIRSRSILQDLYQKYVAPS